MSLFFRRPQRPSEQRGFEFVPFDRGGDSAVSVSEQQARSLPYVFAAMRHICDFGSTLPLSAYRRDGEDRVPIPMPMLFRRKQETGELIPWLSAAFASLATHGNVVGLKRDVDAYGYPREVVWVPFDQVAHDDSGWRIAGQPVPAADIVHIPWLTVPGKTLGLSPLEHYQATVDASLAAQRFGSGWFKAGGVPPGTFRNSERTITPEASEEIRDRLVAAIRSGKPLVHGSDWTYTPITIPPDQAQFVETQKLSANQIAAIYGIEPQEIGGESANGLTYNNEEHRQTKRLANMRPYLVRMEHGLNALIPLEQRVKFNGDAIIRADAKTRHEVYVLKRQLGIASRNELRALEDLPPVPGGSSFDEPAPKTPPASSAVDNTKEDA